MNNTTTLRPSKTTYNLRLLEEKIKAGKTITILWLELPNSILEKITETLKRKDETI